MTRRHVHVAVDDLTHSAWVDSASPASKPAVVKPDLADETPCCGPMPVTDVSVGRP
jgi:hypothetical protein